MTVPASVDENEGVNQPTKSAWAAVTLMVIGFLLCALGFIFSNALWLWIPGGVIGAAGVLFAFTSKLMEQSH